MKKKFNTEKDRLENLKKRGDLIKESFHGMFNRIKRIDEEISSSEEIDVEVMDYSEKEDYMIFDVYTENETLVTILAKGEFYNNSDDYGPNYMFSINDMFEIIDDNNKTIKAFNVDAFNAEYGTDIEEELENCLENFFDNSYDPESYWGGDDPEWDWFRSPER